MIGYRPVLIFHLVKGLRARKMLIPKIWDSMTILKKRQSQHLLALSF
jgi:hypothetical protein